MWVNWTRRGDYYYEGTLIWLDVDTIIRSKTRGNRSLDDFAKVFFGQGKITGPEVVPYTLGEIVSNLDTIAPNDWQHFFQTKVINISPQVNTEGIERAGYRFIYMNEPEVAQETDSGAKDAIWNSIGVRLGDGGRLEDVRRGGPADLAKMGPRQTIVKVGGSPFSLETLIKEIQLKKQDHSSPIQLTVAQEDEEWEVELDYHGGPRYPRVEQRIGTVDMLSAILSEKSFSVK